MPPKPRAKPVAPAPVKRAAKAGAKPVAAPIPPRTESPVVSLGPIIKAPARPAASPAAKIEETMAMANNLALGDGIGAVFTSVWPVAGERRARRGSNPVYQGLKTLYLVAAAVAVILLLAAAVVAGWQPGLSGASFVAITCALLVLAGLAGIYILRRLVVIALDRRGRLQGNHLHKRVLGVFMVVALLPALAVGGIALVIFNKGVDDWFAAKVMNAQEAGLRVAEGYVAEATRTLKAETLTLTQDPMWQMPPLLLSEQTVGSLLRSQQAERALDELVLADEAGQTLASASGFPSVLPHEVLTALQTSSLQHQRTGVRPPETFRQADGTRLFAAVPLSGGRWLVAERALPQAMQAHLQRLSDATQAYRQLQAERGAIRNNLTLLMLLVLLGSLVVAMWAGARLARQLAGPITALVHGTNRVSAGDLTVRLTPRDDDELGVLTQAFNRMTQQLATNADLVERKNTELDARRRLTEAVLLGVSAGVVAVDEAGIVRVANTSATTLLKLQAGDKLSRVTPELSEVLRAFHTHLYEAEVHQRKYIQSHTVKIAVAENADETQMRTLQVRLLPIGGELGKSGVVITFDDITPLVGAQRLAAWQDVARRLAHEIKNPLTPIQLSAARMKRKYLSGMKVEDQPLFGQLADTIVNAAEDMRRMVNEFSDFARMPQAQKEALQLGPLVADVVALQASREGVQVSLENLADDAVIEADAGQIRRALTNLIENAANAVAEREGTNLPQGLVRAVVQKPQDAKVVVEIHDNGRGLPAGKEVGELFDPYVTTRKQGTGLGLAIVKKVMDEHGGTVKLCKRVGGGTTASLTFPLLANPVSPLITGLTTKEKNAHEHPDQTPDTRNPHRRRRG